jgi:hypothetical protein
LNGQPITGTDRSEVMLNLAIYYRKAGGTKEDVVGKLLALADHFEPMVPLAELNQCVDTVIAWDINYRCGQVPLAQVCQRDLCESCRFGVGLPLALRFGPLVKLVGDEVTWIWRINEVDVRLKSGEITNQRLFLRRVNERLGINVAATTDAVWVKTYSAAVIGATPVVSESARLACDLLIWDAFLEFSKHRSSARPEVRAEDLMVFHSDCVRRLLKQ